MKEHAAELLSQPLNEGAPAISHDWEDWVGDLVKAGMAFSAYDDDNYLIGSGGMVPLWPGVCEAWLLASNRIHAMPVTAFRMTDRTIKRLMKDHALHRHQAAIHEDWKVALRFSQALGFREEGLMKNYGSDCANYLRVAKTNG